MNWQLVYQYILSLSKKTENMIKKQNRTSRKEGKKLSLARSNPGPWACDVNAWSIAPRRLMLNVVLILFCLWNSADWRCLKLVELNLWQIERYIRGKQARFWQLTPYFDSFRPIWRIYARQCWRHCTAACNSRQLNEDGELNLCLDIKRYRSRESKDKETVV